jgi:chromosome segregation ATPase
VDVFRKRGLLEQRTVASLGTLARLREERQQLEAAAGVQAQLRSELEQRCKRAEKTVEKAEDDMRAFKHQIDDAQAAFEVRTRALRTAEQSRARVERELDTAKKANAQQLDKLGQKKKRLLKSHKRELQEQEEVLAEQREKYEKEKTKVARLEEKLRKLEAHDKELESQSLLVPAASGRTLSRVVSTYTPSSRRRY